MSRITALLSIALFSIFVGSQITEGWLLLPYWKSLSAEAFYNYYAAFGPVIGQFYTVLTILAALIPLAVCIYCLYTKSPALKYALPAVILTIAFVASFYIYFKGANQQFYDAALDAEQLKQALVVWGYWHWGRVVVEVFALLFLILSLNVLTKGAGE